MAPTGHTLTIARPFLRETRAWLAAILWLTWTLSAHAATFNASLDRTAIGVGETATLSLTFEGGVPTSIPTPRGPSGLVIQYQGQSRQFSMSNGRATSTLAYTFQVTASREGTYVIPPIRVEVDRQPLSSQPLALRVTKTTTPAGLAFLRLTASRDTVYIGEVFTVEVQIYLGARQDSLQMPQIEGEGFIFGKMPQPTQSTSQVGNRAYTVGTFRATGIAVKTGQLTLGPAQCSLVLHVPQGVRNRGFFDDFFGGGVQRKPVTLTSDPLTLTVLPLPQDNQPRDFNGAIGNFSIAASATPTNVTAGDPITLRLQVAGEGNLEALPFPGGAEWPEFKLYPPSSSIESSDELGISGVKTFERVVIPQKPDLTELPAVALSFFDPKQKAYRTVKSAPIPLTVSASAAGPPQPTVLANSIAPDESEPPRRDIVHIKPHLGVVSGGQSPLVTRPWFLALQTLPFLAWISAWAWRQRRENLENNPRLRRRVFVAGLVRKGEKDLYRFAEARDIDAFFAAVFRLLQEQLGERLDLPASAITEAVVDERLVGEAPDDLISKLHRLFQFCNQARYAPQRSTQELMALVPEVESALRQLSSLPEMGPGR